MIGRRNLATGLNQGAVRIKQQLRVVQGTAIALVDADGHHHVGVLGGFANGIGGRGRHDDGLIEQFVVLGTHFERRLHKGKVRVVRHDGFRENGELHAFLAEFMDLVDDLFYSAFTAVEHRCDLDGSGFDDGHGGDLSGEWASTRSRLRQ
ncbi:hypothetical protein D3C84_920790 [compost metagenome]